MENEDPKMSDNFLPSNTKQVATGIIMILIIIACLVYIFASGKVLLNK